MFTILELAIAIGSMLLGVVLYHLACRALLKGEVEQVKAGMQAKWLDEIRLLSRMEMYPKLRKLRALQWR